MKNTELQKVLKEIISKNRVILIDGPWGSGKTYAINEYIKSLDINSLSNHYYLSLFGINDLDELSESVYGRLKHHFGLSKLKGNIKIPILSDIFEIAINLDYVLKDKGIKNKGNGKIMFFDDLERINFKKIDITDVLGFIERLTIYGYTVVIIANLSILEKEVLQEINKFAEKVVQKRIVIDACDKTILDAQFLTVKKSLNNFHKYFDSNIRLAQRTVTCYRDIVEMLENNQIDFDKNKLFELSIKTITGIYTGIGFDDFLKSKGKNRNDLDLTIVFEETEWIDSLLADRLNFVIKRGEIWPSEENLAIVKGIAKYDYDLDISILMEYYKTQNSILMKDSILSNDSDCEKLMKEKIDIIIKDDNLAPELVIRELFRIVDDGYESFINERYEEVLRVLSSDRFNSYLRTSAVVDDYRRQNKEFNVLIEKAMEKNKEEYCDSVIIEIDTYCKQKVFKRAAELCQEICINNRNDFLIDNITKAFKEKDYYLDDIDKTITQEYWDFIYYEAVLIRTSRIKTDYLDYLDLLLERNSNNKNLGIRIRNLKAVVNK